MPAPKTVFIQHSCFGWYDAKFEECTKQCSMSKACKKASESDRADEIRRICKFKRSQIQELADQFK